MKISDLNLYHLVCNLDEPVGSARGWLGVREALLVEAVTDDGISGWGETWAPAAPVAALIRETFAPAVVGRTADDLAGLWRDMMALAGADRLAPAMAAVAALDMALHDAAAKARGVPVAALLGGAQRDSVFAYASGPFMKPGGDPYRGYGEDTERYLRRGYRAVKARNGAGPAEDAAALIKLRGQVGPDIGLMVDFNQGYLPERAIESAQGLAPAGLMWIEEPVAPDDITGYEAVVKATDTPIAGGEALADPEAFEEFLAVDAFAVLQPDVALCAGYTGIMEVAALAGKKKLPVVPHVWGTAISFYASLQLTAALPERPNNGPAPFPYLECDQSGYPMLNVYGETPLNADGTVPLPDGPGIGIEPAAADFAQWIVDQWTVSA